MRTNRQFLICSVALLGLGLTSAALASDQNGTRPENANAYQSQSGQQTTEATTPGAPTKFNKASKLIGMQVQNQKGEDLGDVSDIVINLKSGKVSYVVLSSGGVLGVGEKQLAVPLTAFRESPDHTHLVLHASKGNISQAQGIQNHWPSVQNPNFGAMPFWQTNQMNNASSPTQPGQ